MNKIYIITLLAIIKLFTLNTLNAQALSSLLIPASTSGLSLAASDMAHTTNAFAIYNSTANTLFSPNKFAFGASYNYWQPNMADNKIVSIAGYLQINDRIGIATGFRNFSYPKITITNINGYITGEFQPVEYSADIGIAYKIISNLSLSANISYISSDMGGPSVANAVAIDFGAAFRFENFSVALTAKKIGSKINYGYSPYHLPSTVSLGAAYNIISSSNNKVTVMGTLNYLLPQGSSGVAGAAGIEYSFMNRVALRGGYRLGNRTIDEPDYLSAGVGINFYGVSADFAYLFTGQESPLLNTLSISLSVNLKR